MKNLVLNGCIKLISNTNKEYDQEKLSIIRYGLESIYILLTKLVFIFVVSIFLHIFKEVVIFLLIYNIIRTPSFGLHATKSWMCWIASTIIFIGVPLICKHVEISCIQRAVICSICILRVYKNAPADTYKRPIISKTRRERFKLISTLMAIIMSFSSIFINDMFLANAFMFALVVQCFMISPYVYKAFKLPYDNYKNYQSNGI